MKSLSKKAREITAGTNQKRKEKVGKCDQRRGLQEKIRPQYYYVHQPLKGKRRTGAASTPASAVATVPTILRARTTAQTRRDQITKENDGGLLLPCKLRNWTRLRCCTIRARCAVQSPSLVPTLIYAFGARSKSHRNNTAFTKMTQMEKYCIGGIEPQDDPAELKSKT